MAGYAIPVLTKEQEAEFPGELLTGFANAWLAFRHSSPCTTQKATFPYFTVPGQDEMEEPDILYGPDREQAYGRLMWYFRRCQRARAFDRYFDAAHAQYYEAESVKGLVLLREWTEEQVTPPGLYTGSFRSVKPDQYDEIWLIVRGLKSMPKNPLGNIFHVPAIAPSKNLWYHYLDLKKAGNWNEQTFLADYAPKYLNEMLQPGSMAKFRELLEKTKTQAILCACYCGDENLCHRRLVRMIYDTMRQKFDKKG